MKKYICITEFRERRLNPTLNIRKKQYSNTFTKILNEEYIWLSVLIEFQPCLNLSLLHAALQRPRPQPAEQFRHIGAMQIPYRHTRRK